MADVFWGSVLGQEVGSPHQFVATPARWPRAARAARWARTAHVTYPQLMQFRLAATTAHGQRLWLPRCVTVDRDAQRRHFSFNTRCLRLHQPLTLTRLFLADDEGYLLADQRLTEPLEFAARTECRLHFAWDVPQRVRA